MDAAQYLKRQGWPGDGHALSHSGQGLVKPLLISKKVDVLGVGLNRHAAVSDQWWMRAFDQGLKDLGTGKKGVLGEVREKGVLLGGLYGRFVRGEGVAGTFGEDGISRDRMGEKKRKREEVEGQLRPWLQEKIGRQARAFVKEAAARGLVPQKKNAARRAGERADPAASAVHGDAAVLEVFKRAGVAGLVNGGESSSKRRRELEDDVQRAAIAYLVEQLTPEELALDEPNVVVDIEGESKPRKNKSKKELKESTDGDGDGESRPKKKKSKKESKESDSDSDEDKSKKKKSKRVAKESVDSGSDSKPSKKSKKEPKEPANEEGEGKPKKDKKKSKKESKPPADSDDEDRPKKKSKKEHKESASDDDDDEETKPKKKSKKSKVNPADLDTQPTEADASDNSTDTDGLPRLHENALPSVAGQPVAAEGDPNLDGAETAGFIVDTTGDASLPSTLEQAQGKKGTVVLDSKGKIRYVCDSDKPVPLDPEIWKGIKPNSLPKAVRKARLKWMREKRVAKKARRQAVRAAARAEGGGVNKKQKVSKKQKKAARADKRGEKKPSRGRWG